MLSTDPTSSTSGPALDSTGSRYLVYVWVSTVDNASLDQLQLVNLALCENGWSKAKGVSKTAYADIFTKAAIQAQSLELHEKESYSRDGDRPCFQPR